MGLLPVAVLGCGKGVRSPLVWIKKPEITPGFADVSFATYRNFPAGSMAILCGPAPVVNGDSGVGARSPAAVIAKAEIFPLPEFATYRNLFVGSEMMLLLPWVPAKYV